MADNLSSLSTSSSLLGRVCTAPADQEAWSEFVDRYGRKIYGWCRQWGLQEADAEDVTQDVLLRLAAKMRSFAYDPSRSFRGWLRTLTHHAWSDFLYDRKRLGEGAGQEVLQALEQVEARDDLTRRLDEEFTHALLEEASCACACRHTPGRRFA
jgi:RNA polymerase sigma-70 factor (ECF subfamily)